MIRALILAHDFPPLNSIGARRPVSWYNYFYENGIYPTVITKDWGDKSNNIRDILEYAGTSEIKKEKSERGELIRVPFELSASDKLIVKRGEYSWVLVRKMLTFISLIFSYMFYFFDKHQLIYNEARKLLSAEKFDCIIATGEPFILFKYANKLEKEFGIPWIADFRDGWFLNHVNRQDKRWVSKILRWWEFRFEKKFLKTCKFITSVDPELTKRLGKLHKKKSFVVYNGFEQFTENSELPKKSLPLILSHAGTIYPGHYVEALLDVVSDLHEEKLITPEDLNIYFMGVDFYPAQKQRVMNYKPSIHKYIFTTSRLPNQLVMKFNASADFLLVFTEKNYPVIPAKTYEYISLERPILAVLNDHSILEQLLVSLNAGFLMNSKDALKSFLLDKIKLKRSGLPIIDQVINRDEAAFFTRQNQTRIFAEVIKNNL